MNKLFFVAAGLLAVALGGCGGNTSTPQPVDSFCSEGAKSCKGNYLATCIDGGKAYKLTFCGEGRYCSTASGAAQCRATACEKGALSCDGPKVLQCPDDGASSESPLRSCGAGDKCLGGACVRDLCKDGEVRCGWRRVLSCKSGAWSVTKCGAKQICGGTSCVDRVCTPYEARCSSNREASICNVGGDGWHQVGCKAGDKCYDGVCHREVKGGAPGAGAADAGPSDGGAGDASSSAGVDVPGFIDVGRKDAGLGAPDKLSLILSETPNPPSGTPPKAFSITSAAFLDVGKMLQVTGDEGLYKFELQLAKVEEFQTGNFSAAGGEAEDSVILMNDGTTDQSRVQWKYQSTDYSITITEFGAVGGRFKGSFSAEMGDRTQKGKVVYLVDGKFDLRRSQ